MPSKVSWAWLILPFLTALVTLAHPVIDPWHGGVEGLAPLVQSNTRWIAVHAALLVLFPLSALALSRPVSGIETTSAHFARLMLAVFGVVYAGFDTYAGLATGTVVHYAQDLSAAEQTGVLLAVKGLFNGPIIGVVHCWNRCVDVRRWRGRIHAVAGWCATRAGPVDRGCGAAAVRRSYASVRPNYVRCCRCGVRPAGMAELGNDQRKGLNVPTGRRCSPDR